MSFAHSLRLALPGAILACAFATPASALSAITYVSNTGIDVGACATAATACRTFAYAIAATYADGEVKALTPGNFYPFSLDKGLTVSGVQGATVIQRVPLKDAIKVDAGPSGTVNLFGLTIVAFESGQTGVRVTNTGNVTIKNCLIRGFSGGGVGIAFAQGDNPGFKMRYLVEDTSLTFQAYGIVVGFADGAINRVTVNRTTSAGILTVGPGYVNMNDATITNNGLAIGLHTGSGIAIARSTVMANDTGVDIASGAVAYSAGNNFIHHNHTNVRGTLTVIAPQ
jgi:hypothetical protein